MVVDDFGRLGISNQDIDLVILEYSTFRTQKTKIICHSLVMIAWH